MSTRGRLPRRVWWIAAAAVCAAARLLTSGAPVRAQSPAPLEGTWLPLLRQPAFGAGTALLMTDGAVMVHRSLSPDWWKLTPDAFGSYVNGTWSQVASMQSTYSPLYFASAVLPDGRLVVAGGEYNGPGFPVWTNQGAIYDPRVDVWTTIPPPPTWPQIGDAQAVVLPGGQWLVAHALSTQMGVLDATDLTWTIFTPPNKIDSNNEEGWTLLPEETILAVNTRASFHAEKYVIGTGTWISTDVVPVLLPELGSAEMGPQVLRADGTVFAAGATEHTAVYTPGASPADPGSWSAGPDFPMIGGKLYGVKDGPAALLPSGNVLVGASPGFSPPSTYYEFDGTTLAPMPAPPRAASDPAYVGRMVLLPTGQVLFTDGSTVVALYSPAGTPNPAWKPTITSVPATLVAGTTYQITGTQFNGLALGAAYGDDAQSATNYPLVRITSRATGHAAYARTHDHSTMGVATGSIPVSTLFDMPAVDAGTSDLQVVVNGIASDAVEVFVPPTAPAILQSPRSQVIGPGARVTLGVAATGTAIGYQWYQGTSPGTANPILNAMSASYQTPALISTTSYWVRVSNSLGTADSATATITAENGHATYDTSLRAPTCGRVGSFCDSDALLVGRGTMTLGAEPNQPNSLQAACADGAAGTFHTDESNDGIRVSTVSGGLFMAGQQVRIDARVWASTTPASDHLDLYYTASAANPTFTYLATLTPTVAGAQTLSTTYVLPMGAVQAVRAIFRRLGSARPSGCNVGGLNDHDDLAFTVAPTPGVEIVTNGDFSDGTTSWRQYALPDMSYIVSSVTGGVFQFHQVPPPADEAGQATAYQETGQAVPAGTPLAAEFAIGNSSFVRKRLTVLVIDSDFSDLSVCTFWLPPGAPLRTYRMRTHTTRDWGNAAIYFYAATPGEDGGNYLVSNVSLKADSTQSNARTDCVDPTTPAAAGGSAGPNLVTNGDFGTGALAPWSTAGQIFWQIAGGVFEFLRELGPPAGVVLQSTGQPMTANQILTASFQLGNSGVVRQRVTVLLHDADFSDLTACTFWLPPGQALATYTMRGFATRAWTNATLSIYPATSTAEPWIRLDNVTFQRTPAATIVGTECVEPGGGFAANGRWTTALTLDHRRSFSNALQPIDVGKIPDRRRGHGMTPRRSASVWRARGPLSAGTRLAHPSLHRGGFAPPFRSGGAT